ncbi:ubiquitin system component Cue domain containing protein [Cavenderia fasciculata]|uniref:Ubiquitin system component Cue domain containing protein n=1 Tax=Cavenderia fasciculata TaxID=261658 RepID=F4PIQ5_CACFS|nr:ubiquitin system component Cue domain containing protein [Cavenderia fasciculata]EGG24634.1 ubiquitin system component Cue domain containing protein [Cavenderia fasciculata]|eukprot:XP_004362485.1 ubiquitin system component Cue domain containing protein [Cavenderia fasciculata]
MSQQQQKQQQNRNQQQQPNQRKNNSSNTSSSSSTSTKNDKSQGVIVNEKEKEYQDFEQKKSIENKGIEESYSLVKNSLGHYEKKADLNEYWLTKHSIKFMPFLPLDNSNVDNVQGDEVLLFHNNDLSQLLKTKYHVFWSHVVYNPSLLEFVDSFLRYINRSYPKIDLCSKISSSPSTLGVPSKDFMESKRMLLKRAFSVIVRLSTQQEKTSGDYIGKYYFADLIAKYRIFDVAKLFDICAVFGPSCKTEVVDLVNRVFDIQPKLYSHLQLEAVPAILQSLTDLNLSVIQHNHIDLIKVEDSLRFVLDVVFSIDSFLRIHPYGTHAFFQNRAHYTLVYFYQMFLPLMYNNVPGLVGTHAQEAIATINQHILGIIFSITKHLHLVKIDQYNMLVSEPCNICKKRPTIEQLSNDTLEFYESLNLQHVLNKEKQSKSIVDQFDTLATVHILLDLDKKFNISTKLNYLFKLNSKIDTNRLSLILKSMGKELIKPKLQVEQPQQRVPQQQQTLSEKEKQDIQSIKDIFSSYGDGFVYACLKHFGGNVETTINSLLEDNLPSNLNLIDRSLSTIQSTTTSPTRPAPSPVLTSTTSTTSTSTTRSAPSSSSSTTSTNQQVDNLTKQVYEMHVGKKSYSNDQANIQTNKNFIKNYENMMYEDEYDDSLEVFLGVSVQDGEALHDSSSDEEEYSKNNESLIVKQPKQGGAKPGARPGTKAYQQAHKKHNQKDASAKKRGQYSAPVGGR